MMRTPALRDIRAIAYYSGVVVFWFGTLMLLPILVGVVQQEWGPVIDFALSMGSCLCAGFALQLCCGERDPDLSWTQGMVTVAVAWLICVLLGAIPYALSSHWGSYLDACFDIMSGFTTTGLTLVQDINHLPDAMNTWRHFVSWLGGQGMVVLALSFFAKGLPGAYKIYVGEAKDERLLPNVIHTARAIWTISVLWLVVGGGMLALAGLGLGFSPGRAVLHGFWVYMTAWSTGGFAPMGQNILYYHSFFYEILIIIFMVVGSLNFNLHWSVFTGNRKEIRRNLETITFATTSLLLGGLAIWELGKIEAYSGAVELFRKAYFQIISAHTGTGFMTVYARQFIHEWGPVSMLVIVIAMVLGGSASSTAGGFKAVRVGVALKALVHDIRRLLLPESAVSVEKFHMLRSVVLDDRMVRTAMTIILLYVLALTVGTAAGAAGGYDFVTSLFESASVVGNVGLSAGLTSPAMPAFVKVIYIAIMWVGRLEFLSVFVFFGYIWAGVRRR